MYNKMTSEHSHKDRKSPFKAIETLQKEKYTKFDPEVVTAFVDSLVCSSIGMKVKLSNQIAGEIVFMDHNEPARPIVRLPDGQILSLQQDKSLFIEEIIVWMEKNPEQASFSIQAQAAMEFFPVYIAKNQG